MDPGGWDLQKALRLLGSSNGALIEWFHSPIVYIDRDDFRQRMQVLSSEVVQLDRLRHHYLGMAKQVSVNKLQEPEPSAKSYLYALRALLAAKWIETTQTIPPVRFTEMLTLIHGALREEIVELLQAKASLGEKDTAGKLPEISQFVTSSLNSTRDWTSNKVPGMPSIETSLNEEFLNHFTSERKNETSND